MTRECSEITATLVHAMLDRARLFTSSDLQNEKMISLGKLLSGPGTRTQQSGSLPWGARP